MLLLAVSKHEAKASKRDEDVKMGTADVQVPAGVHAAPEQLNIGQPLPKGLSPQEVAQQYYKSVCEEDYVTYLSCLHQDCRSNAAHAQPGPFRTCHWEEGRARVEKYKVSYKYIGESASGVKASERFVTLKYIPLYGPIPGYEQGRPLGMEVSLVLRQEGGPGGEWRVAEGGC